jgi:hypothetical protein
MKVMASFAATAALGVVLIAALSAPAQAAGCYSTQPILKAGYSTSAVSAMQPSWNGPATARDASATADLNAPTARVSCLGASSVVEEHRSASLLL